MNKIDIILKDIETIQAHLDDKALIHYTLMGIEIMLKDLKKERKSTYIV